MELGKFIPALCILLGLMEPSIAVDQDCNYEQELQLGTTYYVLSPDYPNYYRGRHSCMWRSRSNTRVKLNCTLVEIPASRNCSLDALTIQVDNDIEYAICGLNSFTVESVSSEMIIKFRSSYNTYGGKFRCELTATPQTCSCGWKNPTRIVGGVETGVNEFPMMAGLVDLQTRLLYCGAVIITEKHVVTAAHCVDSFQNNLDKLAVIVGEHDVRRGDETNATQIYFVESIAIHPGYSGKINDVAVVKSTEKFIYSMRVGPVCLPFRYIQNDFTGDTVTALGWGTLTFGGKKSNTLMKVDLNVISLEQCVAEYNTTTPNQICTLGDQKDACQFDSGGPLLWESKSSHRMIFLGVISYGRTCADGKPGVNTRATSYLDFIRSVTPEYNYCVMN
ncbi:hypothetical protein KPH14_012040 [Odynerus spinipes]|uniref:Venom serine protease 34 n=1 Tax=Odynerus spinipes TaxID=1348599 RepID=A0AAD9VT34_9HYME|nr:hypothetical protein KPH14_012040 [Odynerus spinipes]